MGQLHHANFIRLKGEKAVCQTVPDKKNSLLGNLEVLGKGPGEKGAPRNHPEILSQKVADFECRFPYMTPMERADHHFGRFWEKDFGAISGGPFFSRPLLFAAEIQTTPRNKGVWQRRKHINKKARKQHFHGIVSRFLCGFVFVFFSPIRRKTHRQNVATHPVPGKSRTFVYVYVCFLNTGVECWIVAESTESMPVTKATGFRGANDVFTKNSLDKPDLKHTFREEQCPTFPPKPIHSTDHRQFGNTGSQSAGVTMKDLEPERGKRKYTPRWKPPFISDSEASMVYTLSGPVVYTFSLVFPRIGSGDRPREGV